LGFLAKYQAVVAVLPMLVSLFVFSRGRRRRITNLPFLFITALTVALPWVLLVYHVYASGMLQEWFYAIAVGNPQKAQYSSRFPAPVFYLIELTWPYGTVHPISLFLYIIGLTGLAFFTVRRRREDLYLVIWFLSLYAFFTAIGNREWRYMLPVFPVLAVSASSSLTNTAESIRRSKFSKRKRQVLSVLLVTVILAFTTYSCVDAWYWQAKADVHVPVEEAVSYVGQRLVDNESVAVLCPFNLLSQNIVRFTLRAERIQNPVYQYPNLPVDAYTPNFDVEELIQQCVSHNTRYLLLYDNNAEYHFFNTSLTVEKVYDILIKTGRFTLQARVGSSPRTISIIEFSH
jgi:4-amino-4-deoxy-L-arabinose transferase-like glycosyltransferase